MLFIALVKFKTMLIREVVGKNLKDIEDDAKDPVRYHGI